MFAAVTGSTRVLARRRPARARIIGLAAVLAGALATLAVVAAPAAAQSVAELTAKTDDARYRAEALAGEIEAQTSTLAARREQAAAAAAREAELSATLAAGEQRAAALAAAVGGSREQLRHTRHRLHRATARLADRIVTIYKTGSPDTVEVLLTADGYDDLAARVEYLDRIQAADEALIDRARALRAKVAEQLAALRTAREQQIAHNAEVADAREEIAAVRARAEARAAALDDALAARAASLEALRAQIHSWERQVQEAQQVSAAEAQRQVSDWIGGWAIPKQIVLCESGGNFDALNPNSGAGGAYQILPSTWKLYGGKGLPHRASPQRQGEIAAQIWADSGVSAWECAG
jgi:septal ring factor EnvC (AmiA/AmiB activator)